MDPASTDVAYIVVGGSIGAGIVAAIPTIVVEVLRSSRRKTEREEDFARQNAVEAKADQVATQAREAARLLANAQQVSIAATKEVAKVAAVAAAETRTQLKQIHTLVNSDMTAARQAELDGAKANLIVLRRLLDRDREDGKEPNPEDMAAFDATRARIDELQAILADRLVQMKVVEEEAAAAAARK